MGSRHLEAGAVGPQEATAPAQARGTPRRAPPHWAIPYLKKDGNPHRFRQQTVADTRQGPQWHGAGLAGECSNLSRVPKEGPQARPARVKVPKRTLPRSKSLPTSHPHVIKWSSLSNPGTVPGSDLTHRRFRHHPPKSTEDPRLGCPGGRDSHPCTARCPLQPRQHHLATRAHWGPQTRA